MAQFHYMGLDADGIEDVGTIEAANEKQAYGTLASRGITVVELSTDALKKKSITPWYRRDLSFASKTLKYGDQATTATLLNTLLESGLPLPNATRIIARSSNNRLVRRHFRAVETRLNEGENFGYAFAEQNRDLFSPTFEALVNVGDRTNRLKDVLEPLAEYMTRLEKARAKASSALIYPAVLLIAAFALILVVVFYLAPNLDPIFTSLDRQRPPTLAFLMQLNGWLSSYWHIIPIAFGAIFLGLIWVSRMPASSRFLRSVCFSLPVIGRVLRLSDCGRMSLTLELYAKSGVPLLSALRETAASSLQTSPYSPALNDAADLVEAGEPAWKAWEDLRGVPPIFTELFRIGEETNRLAPMLEAASESLAQDFDQQTSRMLSLATPVLTLVLGLGIGMLIYSLMGAILEVNALAF